jgi:hypothetical protein
MPYGPAAASASASPVNAESKRERKQDRRDVRFSRTVVILSRPGFFRAEVV